MNKIAWKIFSSSLGTFVKIINLKLKKLYTLSWMDIFEKNNVLSELIKFN